MPTLDPVGELLLRWEELRDEGKSVPVEELCRDCPELTDVIRRRIQALEAVYRVPNGTGASGALSSDDDSTLLQRAILNTGYEILKCRSRRHGHRVQGEATSARDVRSKMILTVPPAPAARRRAEAEMVAQLQHRISFKFSGRRARGRPYLALELVKAAIWPNGSTARRFPANKRLSWLKPCRPPTAHQRGIVHFDLKPGNVLIADCRLRIADSRPTLVNCNPQSAITIRSRTSAWLGFDVDSGHTQTGTVGTPLYGPEQASDMRSARLHSLAPWERFYMTADGPAPFSATHWRRCCKSPQEPPAPA